ncbi:STAS domain-containing protein [bacterium]|nr:STAS domain-containing protein [bacterium]
MDLSVDFISGVSVVLIDADYLDSRNSLEFFNRFQSYNIYSKWLLLDFSKIETINFSGISALLLCQSWGKQHNFQIAFICVNQRVRMTMQLVHQSHVFKIFESQKIALTYISEFAETNYFKAV